MSSSAAGRSDRRGGAARSVRALDRGRFQQAHRTPSDWLPLLDGIDAVVNCVGVLEQGGARRHRSACMSRHDRAVRGLRAAGVRRVIHISAIGADRPKARPNSRAPRRRPTRDLATLDLDWVILRPGAGAGAGGLWRHRDAARARGVSVRDAGGRRRDARFRWSSVDDVAETVAFCLAPGAPAQAIWDVAHPQPLSARRDRRGAARLARVSAAAGGDGAGAGRGCRQRSSPMRSAGSAGAARRARPRWRSLSPAWSAIRRRGCGDRHRAEKPCGHSRGAAGRACRSAGSRGSICSSRWRSSGWRCSGSPPAWSRSGPAAPRRWRSLPRPAFRRALPN